MHTCVWGIVYVCICVLYVYVGYIVMCVYMCVAHVCVCMYMLHAQFQAHRTSLSPSTTIPLYWVSMTLPVVTKGLYLWLKPISR